MKQIAMASLCLLMLGINSSAHAEEKWTFERAMESHKQNVGSSYIDHNAYLAEWNSVNRIPIGNEGLGGAESNWELISTLNNSCNSATGCTLAKPITDYDEVLVFGRNNGERSRGSVLIPVNEIDFGTRDNADRYHISLSRRSDGNDYVNFYFENPKKLFHYTSMDFYQFAEVYGRGKSKRPKECDAGVVEDLVTYCTEIGQRTCEAGLVKRTCASYGDWLPWETIRLPSCVWGSQDCK